jgi:uncharacterized protein YcbX
VSAVIEQLWRYPIKSIGGELVETSSTGPAGLDGDRVWAVQDESGKLGSGKDSKRFTRMLGLLGLTSRYPEPEAPPVVVGPDGALYPVAGGAADDYLSELCTRPVRVRAETGHLHFDEVPVSLVGTATLSWLADELPGVAVDARRLRPNLVVRTDEPFAEEQWLGRPVRIGSAVVVFDRVFQRCVMVGMSQPGLPDSSAVLKRISAREDNPLCLAIGGHIVRPGALATGQPLHVGPD